MTASGWTLVVLAAGLGRRFGGDKQLEPLGPSGETLADYSVWDAWRAGAGALIYVTRPELESACRERTDRWTDRLTARVVAQRLEDVPGGRVPPGRRAPWGTLHAVLAARRAIPGPFVVVNADDTYGPEAFRACAAFLEREAAGSPSFAAAGYELAATVSAHGGVSRALLRHDGGGRLLEVRELTDVTARGSEFSGRDGDHAVRLTATDPVSMNCWALLPGMLPLLFEELVEFLERHGSSPDAEARLPDALGHLLSAGRAEGYLLPAGVGWLGLTHPGDRAPIAAALRARVARGEYPADLFAASPAP